MLWIVYNLLFPIVFLCMLPKFISRMLKRGGYGSHFEQRVGHFGHNTKAQLRERRRVWVHAVSVGEIFIALRFMKAYREAHPEACFALSTTSSTGHAIGRKEIDPRDVLFYFPVDLPVIIKKVLRIINPLQIVLVEGEFWPNLIRLADDQGIPVSLINGRMSKKSYKGYRLLKPLTADVLRRIDPICVQSRLDAERMIGIGAPKQNVHVMGTVKFDVAERDLAGEKVAQDTMRKLGVDDGCTVLLGGSTWPGEEAVLCELYKKCKPANPNLFLVIVPRHVERAADVVQALEGQGLSFVRRSLLESYQSPERPDVLFVDTTGELRNFYSVADIIFVGKSLTENGGQNPIEPAMYGKAVVVGPNMENFPSVMEEFLKSGAIKQVDGVETLNSTVDTLLLDPTARERLGRRAAQVVSENRGVIESTVGLLGGE
ncbi:3-deoxy-D-manno-octulosonic acid transferase [Pontiella sulfatireligans]|uniref:3-deoxy-D-manno-octulosonic acid transferase n=1 Tax=Pontiella sulfatireligans TaxID=2750658 RepID=A0A6C2ULW8_9BACT|nr:3-deoxy-D-manno-octulosonic acid transferase [Pontiella sulfatireligans]VGO21255.1 3-deoxy-D-manno-octulosonic acid transferase [Pontiella sulfatireligans]